jgi:outer membrane protein
MRKNPGFRAYGGLGFPRPVVIHGPPFVPFIWEIDMRSALLVAVVMAFTQTALAADLKVGYVDMARALNEVEEGKAAKSRLKKEFDKKQKELDKMQSMLKAKQAEFEKRKAMMKEDVRNAKIEEMQRDFLELQQTYARLQKELLDEETKLTQKIGVRVTKIVEKIGDRDSYYMILNIADNVLYYKRHQDITDEVVKMYNSQYGKK